MTKKGKQTMRLIIDARASNQLFGPPPGVDLLTPEGLSRTELGPAVGVLHIATADVEDTLRRCRLTPLYASYFGLPSVTRREMRLDGDAEVVPCCSSVPMGHTWSLYFCQTTGESLLSEARPLSGSLSMCSYGRPLVLGHLSSDAAAGGHYVYGGCRG